MDHHLSDHLFDDLPGSFNVLSLLSLAPSGRLLSSIRDTCSFHSSNRCLGHLNKSGVSQISRKDYSYAFVLSIFISDVLDTLVNGYVSSGSECVYRFHRCALNPQHV